MPPSQSRRAAAIARLAGIAASMAAAPAIAATIAGPAGAAVAPAQQSAVTGAAAADHLSTLFDPSTTAQLTATASHGPQRDTTEPNPFHQFHQFNQGPFHQGSPFDEDVPFHQWINPFDQLVEP
ncbi:hypothetical protein [Nocardia arthritidis]|uniref:Uncharacterized protein n=1 Tax=Nocardia arthritidis TaxID=228602 RepID=A0A6G9Y545_9NOCA|nr:hypothetical protein [Nocardia arthritidis]QIS08193.1 hypothetical protein F5544_01340 [Nocardia arthritidis]